MLLCPTGVAADRQVDRHPGPVSGEHLSGIAAHGKREAATVAERERTTALDPGRIRSLNLPQRDRLRVLDTRGGKRVLGVRVVHRGVRWAFPPERT
jgi:hypothetical protein